MLRKLVRGFVFVIVGLAVAGGILYAAGLRIVFYGGGGIGLAFLQSAGRHAAEIEKHREAQRAQAPPEPPAQPLPQLASPAAAPLVAKPSPAAVNGIKPLDELSRARS